MARKPAASRKPTTLSSMVFHLICSENDGLIYALALQKLLRAHGFTLWRSDLSMKPGEDWIEMLTDRLRTVTLAIFIATPATLRSASLMRELELFHELKRPILCITFRDIINPNNLPTFARDLIWQLEDQSALRVGPGPGVLQAIVSKSLWLAETAPKPPPKPLQRTPKEERPLNEGKIILVGRGEVGKTSIVRRLLSNRFRGDESKTQGINIASWPLRHHSTRVRLNVWDFGGQEIMHATHQFFSY